LSEGETRLPNGFVVLSVIKNTPLNTRNSSALNKKSRPQVEAYADLEDKEMNYSKLEKDLCSSRKSQFLQRE